MKNSLSYTFAYIFPGVKLLSQNIMHGSRLSSLLYSSFPLAICFTHVSMTSWRDGIEEWEGGSRGKACMCVYTHTHRHTHTQQLALLVCRNQQNIVKQLPSNLKIFFKLKNLTFDDCSCS